MSERFMIHGAVLGAFCLGFGALLAVTNRITSADIALRAMEDRQNSLGQVIPASLHDNNPVADTITLTDDQGQPLTVYRALAKGQVTGVAYEINGSGYAGQIKLMLGVAADGKVLGVRVLAHKETPGLGDKIEVKKGNWIQRFTGLALGNPPADQWKVKKDGGEVDQFTGATITPRGVVGAVRDGLAFFTAHQTQMTEVR
jgi:electron transport complex protein RnfG